MERVIGRFSFSFFFRPLSLSFHLMDYRGEQISPNRPNDFARRFPRAVSLGHFVFGGGEGGGWGGGGGGGGGEDEVE